MKMILAPKELTDEMFDAADMVITSDYCAAEDIENQYNAMVSLCEKVEVVGFKEVHANLCDAIAQNDGLPYSMQIQPEISRTLKALEQNGYQIIRKVEG